MKAAVTVKQLQLLNALRKYQTDHPDGPGPTLVGLGEMLGLKKSTIGRTMATLHRKGWVTAEPGHARSWQVVEDMKVFVGWMNGDAILVAAVDEEHAKVLAGPKSRLVEVDTSKPVVLQV